MAECLRLGCSQPVPRSRLACRGDWRALPSDLRSDISTAYRRHDRGEHHSLMRVAIAEWLAQDAEQLVYFVPGGHTYHRSERCSHLTSRVGWTRPTADLALAPVRAAAVEVAETDGRTERQDPRYPCADCMGGAAS